MLCLTVYESKGLEFDDVILYNFFTMGEIKKDQWKLLNNITPEQSYRKQLPDWLLEKNDGFVEGEEGFEAYKRAIKRFENEGYGAEYIKEWNYEFGYANKDEAYRKFG